MNIHENHETIFIFLTRQSEAFVHCTLEPFVLNHVNDFRDHSLYSILKKVFSKNKI